MSRSENGVRETSARRRFVLGGRTGAARVDGFECSLSYAWRPNYDIEMHECAKAFEFRNVYEGEVPVLGEPREKDATVEELGDRKYQLVKGSLVCMIGAALAEPIDSYDFIVSMHVNNWHGQFDEALSVARERSLQLAPDGLPIWKD